MFPSWSVANVWRGFSLMLRLCWSVCVSVCSSAHCTHPNVVWGPEWPENTACSTCTVVRMVCSTCTQCPEALSQHQCSNRCPCWFNCYKATGTIATQTWNPAHCPCRSDDTTLTKPVSKCWGLCPGLRLCGRLLTQPPCSDCNQTSGCQG